MVVINTAINLIGIFSKSIVKFMGEHILIKYLNELITVFDQDIINSIGKDTFSNSGFEGESGFESKAKNFKYILGKQKQYFSLVNSYANIVGNLKTINELIVNVRYLIY